MNENRRAPRNRTITLTDEEKEGFAENLLVLSDRVETTEVENTTICQDNKEAIEYLPDSFVDLLFLDPPYNISKSFGGSRFQARELEEYGEWLASWFRGLLRTLKPTASVYVCGDWRSSAAIHQILGKHLIVRNRITWQREKGRGATTNWKNSSEDIWFATVSDNYTFNVDAVKNCRRVRAPYRDEQGDPKDWIETDKGRFRLTHPSNIWTDLTIPFWSMPENTDHPTQKPEKLLARVLLASSNRGDLVFDPFLGSGTTSVVAKKLGRRYVGIERNTEYCCLAEKRLAMADDSDRIQGYTGGVFWHRNTRRLQKQFRRQDNGQKSFNLAVDTSEKQ